MQINQKAAESLADPEEYPNLFEDWQLALGVESKLSETRFNLLLPPCLFFVMPAVLPCFRCMHATSLNFPI